MNTLTAGLALIRIELAVRQAGSSVCLNLRSRQDACQAFSDVLLAPLDL